MRIAGDADHHRIDLKESPALSALAEAGETSGAEANRRHAIKAAEGVARRRHCFTNRTANVVVRQWHRRPADRRAVLVTQSLRAMHRGGVIQPARPAVGDFHDLVDAEEAARGLDRGDPPPPKSRHPETQDREPKKA